MFDQNSVAMSTTEENNHVLEGGPPGFKTPQPVVGSSKLVAEKGKAAAKALQLNIFEALQHIFSPEQP